MARVRNAFRRLNLFVFVSLAFASMSAAGAAQTGDDFAEWLAEVKREAAARGISAQTIEKTLGDLEPQTRVLELDQRQPEFTVTFWRYISRAVSDPRIERGRELLARHGPLLRRIQARYGVQPRFLVALWGLESNFGDNMGGFPVVAALATLAFDPRRGGFFRGELFEALEIVDQGHIAAEKMVGSWAGAMGQVQFLPSTFQRHAIDQDGDGRRDIWNSVPDALGSAANYLRAIGWQGDELWGREVRVPADFDLNLATLETRKPVREWAKLGVRRADGRALPDADIGGSLLLPGGHRGPAFLVYRNYDAILEWNRSLLYALAVGILSDRIADRAALVAQQPANERPLSRAEVEEMQSLLSRLGYDIGEVDGVVGAQTRAALRRFQQSANLPPDGYPTPQVLDHLRRSESP